MAEPSLSNLLQAAIQDVKQGNMKAAKTALSQVISAEPDSFYAEKAWIWMSATVSDSEQKRMCLENALKINPENVTAQKGLEKLPPPPVIPDDKEEFEVPEWIAETNFETESINAVSSPQNSQPKSNQEQKVSPTRKSDQQLIDEYVAQQTTKGWQVISYTGTSVQMRKPKQWDSLLLILGLLLSCLYGVGLLILLLALVDYLLQKEKVVFATAEELRAGTIKPSAGSKSSSFATAIVILGVIFIGLVFLSVVVTFLFAG